MGILNLFKKNEQNTEQKPSEKAQVAANQQALANIDPQAQTTEDKNQRIATRPNFPLGTNETFSTFGKMARLLAMSHLSRKIGVGELETMLLPAIVSGQFLVAESTAKAKDGISENTIIPLAFALWARVSEEVDTRLCNNIHLNLQLSAAEWKSGEIPWLIMAAGDQNALNQMLTHFVNQSLNGRPLKTRIIGSDGNYRLSTFPK